MFSGTPSLSPQDNIFIKLRKQIKNIANKINKFKGNQCKKPNKIFYYITPMKTLFRKICIYRAEIKNIYIIYNQL